MRINLLYFIPVAMAMVACMNAQKQQLPKINGVSLVNPHQPVDVSDLEQIKRLNANYVAVIPFGFSHKNEPEIHFNHDGQWWGERLDGTRELIRLANRNGFEVMLKPHVWMRRGWIGDYDLDDEKKWLLWEQQYEDYILTFAELAEEMSVPLLCIGTELKVAVVKRPEFWVRLIEKVRMVYSGKLTYASNWDNYTTVSFWAELDYIGVDAYFPLVHESDPDSKSIDLAWESIKLNLANVSRQYRRQILFTEFGYQSVNGAVGNHWEVEKSEGHLNMELQARAYACLFEAYWHEEWFAGGFLWKWHFREGAGGLNNPNFTPQGKPSEKVIRAFYSPN